MTPGIEVKPNPTSPTATEPSTPGFTFKPVPATTAASEPPASIPPAAVPQVPLVPTPAIEPSTPVAAPAKPTPGPTDPLPQLPKIDLNNLNSTAPKTPEIIPASAVVPAPVVPPTPTPSPTIQPTIAPPPAVKAIPEPAPASSENPALELPKLELPKIEAPKVELPKVEAPKAELPLLEIPAAPKAAPSESLPPMGPMRTSKSSPLNAEVKPFDIYPVDGKAPTNPAAKRTVRFFNISDRDIKLTVNGETGSLPKQSVIAAELPANFTWKINSGKEESTEIPANVRGLEVIIRK
jgi:hypothetical protein